MRYNWELRHLSSVGCLETFRSIFAVTLPLVRSNSWKAQLVVPHDPRYARLETNLGIKQAMAPHTITPAVGAVCRCKAKAGLKLSPRGLHTRILLSSLLRLNLDSSLKTIWFHSTAVQFPRARHHSKRRCRCVSVKGITRNGCRDLKCHSTRRLRMVREDTGAPSEGATCAWLAADEDVGCTRVFLTICQVIYSQFGLAIHQNDHQARRRSVEWAQNEIAVVPDFHKRNLFSDEAHFWLNGYVNKQNCRIWSEANPQVYVETPLHPEKLIVWCALWAGGIIGPYFFKNDEGHNVTVNGDRYRAMITNFFIPELNNHDIQELWFQQDSSTCHTARATIDLLKDTFVDRLISRFGPVNWPPRSCDLTPLNYFLWSYVKSLVYADKPQTLDHLEDNIRRVIADIRPQMLEKVIENWTSKLDYIRASRGSPMPEIMFKM
ncbi:DUF4817 domain-containing protein [Trichonephila clavipes]|nr:DUF4817 domain-containing protein [Trichonephila clavipes]